MAVTSSWLKKLKLTILSSQVDADGDYIVPITLDHIPEAVLNAGGSSALNGGGDIRFASDANGTNELPVFVSNVVTNATRGNQRFHVLVRTTLSASTDTDIWMFYNNSSASLPSAGDTYGYNAVFQDCVAAYHLGFSRTIDLSGNSKTLTVSNAPTAITGEFDGGAQQFNGTNDYLSSANNAFNSDPIYTIETRYKHTTNTMSAYGALIAIGGFDTNDGGMTMNKDNTSNVWEFTSWNAGTSIGQTQAFPSTNSWNTVHMCSDGTGNDTKFAWNGSIIGSENTSHSREESTTELRIGRAVPYGDYGAGALDMLYIYDFYPSDNYISTRHNMLNSPSTFITESSPEDNASNVEVTATSDETITITKTNANVQIGADTVVTANASQTISITPTDTTVVAPEPPAFPVGWTPYRVAIQASQVEKTFTGSSRPVPIRLSNVQEALVDAGSGSGITGGGDLRITSDLAGSNRLPLDVVEFVPHATEGSRRCHLWTLPTTISSSTNTDLYIWTKNGSSETQPAVDDTYGRNAVWANEEVVILTENNGTNTVIDRTGNHTITKNGTFASAGAEGLDFNGTNAYLSIPDAAGLDFSSGYALRFLVNNVPTDTIYSQIVSKPLSGAWGSPYLAYGITIYPNSGGDDRNGVAVAWGTSSGSYIDPTESESARQDIRDGGLHYIAGVYSDANNQNRMYVDGALEQTVTDSGALDNTSTALLIGRNTTGGSFFEWMNGNIPVGFMRETIVDTDEANTEDNMLRSPSTFILPVEEVDVEVTANASQTIAITPTNTTVVVETDVVITATIDTISITGTNTTVNVETNTAVTANTETVTITETNANVVVETDVIVVANSKSISINPTNANIFAGSDLNITADVGTISISTTNTIVDIGSDTSIISGLGTVTINTTNANVVVEIDTIVTADVETVTISGTNAIVNYTQSNTDYTSLPAAASINITLNTPTVIYNTNYNSSPDLASLEFTLNTPTVTLQLPSTFTATPSSAKIEIKAKWRLYERPQVEIDRETRYGGNTEYGHNAFPLNFRK